MFNIGDRVSVAWTFKNDGSWRNGTIVADLTTGYTVRFDDGREESHLNEIFNERFVLLYDYPQPTTPIEYSELCAGCFAGVSHSLGYHRSSIAASMRHILDSYGD